MFAAMCALFPAPRGAPQVPTTCLTGGREFGVISELHLMLFVVLGLLERKGCWRKRSSDYTSGQMNFLIHLKINS